MVWERYRAFGVRRGDDRVPGPPPLLDTLVDTLVDILASGLPCGVHGRVSVSNGRVTAESDRLARHARPAPARGDPCVDVIVCAEPAGGQPGRGRRVYITTHRGPRLVLEHGRVLTRH